MAVKWIFDVQMQKDIKIHIYDSEASNVGSLAWVKLWTCDSNSSTMDWVQLWWRNKADQNGIANHRIGSFFYVEITVGKRVGGEVSGGFEDRNPPPFSERYRRPNIICSASTVCAGLNRSMIPRAELNSVWRKLPSGELANNWAIWLVKVMVVLRSVWRAL